MKLAPEHDPGYIERHPYRRITAGAYDMGADYRIVRERGLKDHLIIATLAGGGVASDEALRAGTLFHYAPGEPHDYGTAPAAGRWRFLWAHIHAPLEWSPLLDWRRLDLRHIPQPERHRIFSLFKDAVHLAASPSPLDEALAMNLVENILLRIKRHSGGIAELEFARDVRDFILQNLAANLSVDTLARRFKLSRSRFAHRFKDATGTSVQVFVEDCRIEAAKGLLLATDKSVKEIALTLGFADPLYFTRRFTLRTGQPPTVWRG